MNEASSANSPGESVSTASLISARLTLQACQSEDQFQVRENFRMFDALPAVAPGSPWLYPEAPREGGFDVFCSKNKNAQPEAPGWAF
jgi:hypothetical protein